MSTAPAAVPSKDSKESKASSQTKAKRSLSADDGFTKYASGTYKKTNRKCDIFYCILDKFFYIADQQTGEPIVMVADEEDALALINQSVPNTERATEKKAETKYDPKDHYSFDGTGDGLFFTMDDQEHEGNDPVGTDSSLAPMPVLSLGGTPSASPTSASSTSSGSDKSDQDTYF
jgi:hypothetical protein